MRVLVNGLSIGSLSGQHVVFGFLEQLIKWTGQEHEFLILHDQTQALPESIQHPAVSSLPVSSQLRNWVYRAGWEFTQLPKLIREHNIDVLLNPSGALAPRIPCKQVVLCQNPWCFVPKVHRGLKDKFKAALQRRGYANAFRSADLMIFISDHLRSLYQQAAGTAWEANSVIAFVGINDSTFDSAAQLRNTVERDPFLIVSVSAMAHWKGADTLIEAIRILRNENIPAKLRLVGPWPDAAYEQQIRQQIEHLKLQDAVEITGKVSKEELHQNYAEAKLFSLMSDCESFGIPAAEAQAFGTPVVISTGCAMPEVCGLGALAGPPGDAHWTANAFKQLLTSQADWQRVSDAALLNVEKLRWEVTARPFMSLFSLGQETYTMQPPEKHHVSV